MLPSSSPIFNSLFLIEWIGLRTRPRYVVVDDDGDHKLLSAFSFRLTWNWLFSGVMEHILSAKEIFVLIFLDVSLSPHIQPYTWWLSETGGTPPSHSGLGSLPPIRQECGAAGGCGRAGVSTGVTGAHAGPKLMSPQSHTPTPDTPQPHRFAETVSLPAMLPLFHWSYVGVSSSSSCLATTLLDVW